jgi:exodeoxyribonuclease VII small subunit
MAEKKFEGAMKRLEDIVQSLESDDLTLEGSIGIFEEGMKLVNFCSKKLEEAEQKVTMLVKAKEGEYHQRPFEMDEKQEA